MHRFRSTWLALMAGGLLVTLSVSAALGAAPAGTRDATRGQAIAGLVHELIFGSDETDDPNEELVEQEEEQLVEDDEELQEEEPIEEEADEAADAHGECVAEEASDQSDEIDEDRNHGAVVSEAARVTCWEADEAEDDIDEVIEEEDEEPTDEEENEEADSHGACVSAAAHDRDGSAESELKNHGKWVSQHARYTCWGLDVPADEADEDATDEEETSDADATSAEADRGGGKPSWAGNGNGGNAKPSWAGNGNGDGNGRGGGRR